MTAVEYCFAYAFNLRQCERFDDATNLEELVDKLAKLGSFVFFYNKHLFYIDGNHVFFLNWSHVALIFCNRSVIRQIV